MPPRHCQPSQSTQLGRRICSSTLAMASANATAPNGNIQDSSLSDLASWTFSAMTSRNINGGDSVGTMYVSRMEEQVFYDDKRNRIRGKHW